MEGIEILMELLTNLVSFAFSIGTYVLTALGLYTIAKRRGIRNPWIAFVPVAQLWTLGCIGDQYRYVAKNQVKSRRKVLLWLYVPMVIALIVFAVFFVLFLLEAMLPMMSNTGLNSGSVEPDIQAAMTFLPGMLISLLVYAVVAIVYIVFYYIALYDVYASCNPEYRALFIVLSILFNITVPFFVFFNRKNDLGMPPRRDAIAPQYQPPQYQPQYQPPQYQPQAAPTQEPWSRPAEPSEPWNQPPQESEPWQQEP